jgi:hypothetical protein
VDKAQSVIASINHKIVLTLHIGFSWLLSLSLIIEILFSTRTTLIRRYDIVVNTFVEFLDSMISTKRRQ